MNKKRFFVLVFFISIYFNASVIFADINVFEPPTNNYEFKEDFESETDLKLYEIISPNNKVSITENGTLQFGDYRYTQWLSFNKSKLSDPSSYGVEFTVNVKLMGNGGDQTRPIIMLSPRSRDDNFEKKYAITYYLENLQMGQINANLYSCKWAIVNTNAPSGFKPLAEGYYLLEEDVNYIGRFSIENLPDKTVKIQFFIDGPSNPSNPLKPYAPLMTYIDQTSDRILNGSKGPAFGITGFDDDLWGNNPIVEYDNIKIYNIEQFKKRTDELLAYSKTWVSESLLKERYLQVRSLINNRYVLTTLEGDLRLDEPATIGDFLFSLYAMDVGDYKTVLNKYEADKTKSLNRLTASEMLYLYLNKPACLEEYKNIVLDIPINADAMHFLYQQGYFALDEKNKFNPQSVLTRLDYIDLIAKVSNPKLRTSNGVVTTSEIIGNNAIFQRDKPIRLWGKGMSGDIIKVTFDQSSAETKVIDGNWSIILPSRNAGGPYNLKIEDSSTSLSYSGIYVGEVFIIAGQSNAEMRLNETQNMNSVIDKLKAEYNIHFFYNKHQYAISPRDSAGGKWYFPDQWGLEVSPAIGTYFVNELVGLNNDLKNVKIGIIRLTYGGSSIENFIPPNSVSKSYVQRLDSPVMSAFWNGFIDYISPYSVKGVIFYQGENSTQLGYSYESLLRSFISGLRDSFQDQQIPIILVQVAGYGDNYYETDSDTWPIIRAVQMRTANTMSNVGLISAIDLSDEDPYEIHPKVKRPIGYRLANLAMIMMYNSKGYVSPEVSEAIWSGNEFLLSLKHIGDGITVMSDKEHVFEVLDKEGNWISANYKLSEEGNQIKVWSDLVELPIGVRYGWHNYPQSTVFNSYGMPLLPFNSKVNLKYYKFGNVETKTFQIKISNHMLNTFDAVENVTRVGDLRSVKRIDANLVYQPFYTFGQKTGDVIKTFRFLGRQKSENGTTSTIIKINNHGLEVDDWIRNNSKSWTNRKVLEVVDQNTIRVNTIENQQVGDEIELYHYFKTYVAE